MTMSVKEAIENRRAYRSLEKIEITEEIIHELSLAASLSASCFNNQPWRFVFVYDKEDLEKFKIVFNKGNEWCHADSLVIAVVSEKSLDCDTKGRQYYLFDTGMATALLILRATELGLVAHPIAGYDEQKVKELLAIPESMTVITLVNVGKHSDKISPVLSEKQAHDEKERPSRLALNKFVFRGRYGAQS
ncbi:MAG: nitroreductase family protein [Candidatus Margulisiibacteriota bacterium]